MIFDKNILKLHRKFALQNIYKSDFLIEHAACGIIENLELLNIKPFNILELGGRAGHLSRKLSNLYPTSKLTITEMVETHEISTMIVDDEKIDFLSNSFDLITSCMNFHWVNEVEKFLCNINKILTKEGKFILNFIASGSLSNLAKFLIESEIEAGNIHRPHIIPLPKEEKVQMIFQQTGFSFVVVSSEKIELEYTSPIELMKDLKNIGENNALFKCGSALPKRVIKKVNTQYTPFLDTVNLINVVAGK